MYTDYSSLTPSVLVRPPNRSYYLGTPGQVPAEAGKAQMLPQRKTTIWRSSYEGIAIGREREGPLGVESLDRGIGAGLFPEARPRGTTPRVGNRFIVADGQEARGDTAAPPIARRHEGSCYRSHPRLWHPIMAMNSGHCQRKKAHNGNM
jgi:hypothetical protein